VISNSWTGFIYAIVPGNIDKEEEIPGRRGIVRSMRPSPPAGPWRRLFDGFRVALDDM
jgi:hypothetical protein